MRRSGGVLLYHLLLGEHNPRFPKCVSPDCNDDSGNGAFGIMVSIVTENGNDFYPCVAAVYCDSPAYREGVRPFDIIVGVDGSSTLNWSCREFLTALNKMRGEKVVLTLKRDEQQEIVTVIAADEDVAAANWTKLKYRDSKGKIRTKRRRM